MSFLVAYSKKNIGEVILLSFFLAKKDTQSKEYILSRDSNENMDFPSFLSSGKSTTRELIQTPQTKKNITRVSQS